jgi:hypothetical protein
MIFFALQSCYFPFGWWWFFSFVFLDELFLLRLVESPIHFSSNNSEGQVLILPLTFKKNLVISHSNKQLIKVVITVVKQ